MSDIVVRLRDDQPGERQREREARMDLGGLLTEAADEIEKLRADNTRLRESLGAAARDALRDENARLRSALDFYACVDHYQIHNAAAPNVVQFDRGAKARAALGEKK
jgi:hypothetical protein